MSWSGTGLGCCGLWEMSNAGLGKCIEGWEGLCLAPVGLNSGLAPVFWGLISFVRFVDERSLL